MAWHLAEVMRGNIKRLLITLPPRNLKSLSASVAFPAWVLGKDPSKRIICVSYGSDLATDLSNKHRQVINSGWYKDLFPAMRIDPKKNTQTEVRTTKGGYRLATTVDGALTGRGGSIIIVDDPLKASDATSEASRLRVKTWYDQTLLTRLDNKKEDAIILVMQRLHEDDLAGHVLGQDDWVHLCLPAICDEPMSVRVGPNEYHTRREGDVLDPDREPIEVLERFRRSMGSAAFSAQYQQQPIPVEGNLVRWRWFSSYDTPPKKSYQYKLVQSWDTASKSHELADYSACITAMVGKNDIYLLNVYRGRLEYPELKKKILELRKSWGAETVLIEDKGSGMGLLQDLRRDGLLAIPIKPEGDKIVRMSTCSAKIEAGHVYLPNGAGWLHDFKPELLAFPNGKHDDQVDALSQLINWDRTRSRYTLDNVC
jgi:predicted phage terminase large subunit-like protein